MTTSLPDILIVEDDDTIRMLLCEILALQPATIRSAADGHTALELIHAAVPNLLISDLHMPGMSGFELLIIVRETYPQIHVIATSGAYYGPDIPRGVVADAYYEKTSGIRNLIALVENGVARGSQRDPEFVSAERIPPHSVQQNYRAAA